MFEEFDAPLPDRKRYLERIGLPGASRPDLETLNALILAQLRSVPFENLDVYDAGTDIRLEIEALFDKIVLRRRGGYCFELNALFMGLLKELGYRCYPVMVRVVWRATGYMPISHRAGIITIDGTRYFCDVGFGGPSPSGAIKLDEPGPQQSGANNFIFDRAQDGDFVIYRITETGREQLLKFQDRPCENVDFLGPNEYQSHNSRSGFKMARMVNIATETGSSSISGGILRVHKDGEVCETPLDTEDKLRQALRDRFGIAVDFQLKV